MSDVEQNANSNQSNNDIVYLWKIPIDKSYVKSMDSLIKVIIAVLSFITFITGASGRSEGCDDRFSSTYNYFEFVAISCFLTILSLWLCHTITLDSKLCMKMVPWRLVDVIYLVVYLILFLIASICMAAQDCDKDSNKAAAAFGFFVCIGLGVNGFFSFKVWRSEGGSMSSSQGQESTSPAGEYNPEKQMEQY